MRLVHTSQNKVKCQTECLVTVWWLLSGVLLTRMATKSLKGEKRQRKIPNRFKDNGMPSDSANICESK